jgi:FkbM family methyltransferase
MTRIMDKNFDNIILKEIKKSDALIFDIGAGQAESISRFKKLLPNSTIHSFEPVKKRIEIIEDFLKTFPHNNNITLNHCAMGDKLEEKIFNVNDKTKTSSFLKIK